MALLQAPAIFHGFLGQNMPGRGKHKAIAITYLQLRDTGLQVFAQAHDNVLPLAEIKRGKLTAEVKVKALPQVNEQIQELDIIEEVATTTEKFMLFAEGGNQVIVKVQKGASKYIMNMQILLSSPSSSLSGPLYLHWGLYRTDSSDWAVLEPHKSPPKTIVACGLTEAMQTPFLMDSVNSQSLILEFDAELAPFYVAFVLYKPPILEKEEVWIRNVLGMNFCVPVGIRRGSSEPLGFTRERNGHVNFALYSKNASNVVLCLYSPDDIEPSLEIDLDPGLHRTGNIWHVELESLGDFERYGYRCKGDVSWENGNRFNGRCVLLDPYAKFIAPTIPGQEKLPSPAAALGWMKDAPEFDWEDDRFPCIPLEATVAYRLNVSAFTKDASSGVGETSRGSFSGIKDKVDYFLSLGVNAVILQPIFAHGSQGPFHPLSFFAPMGYYGSNGDSILAGLCFKEMVKELHKNGIEVLLDAIYSHTAENGDESALTATFRGIDNATYYILDSYGKILSSEYGAANAFNCNHPVVHRMILDSLRYWVEEYHVDGFCFKNAMALTMGPHGQKLSRPLLVEAISFDPLLSNSKLIADAGSPISGICKEPPFPHWKHWCELNNSFRNDIRQFFRGDKGMLSKLATRLCGSGDVVADGRGPSFSMNFITSSDGFSLADLVSYSSSDAARSECSWNCGEEGPSLDQTVLETRVKQVRNMLMGLFLSHGIPVLNMGDEYGHSKGGRLTVDESLNYFQWNQLKSKLALDLRNIVRSVCALRLRRKELFQKKVFASIDEVKWHGAMPNTPLWENPNSSFLAVSLQVPPGAKGSDSLGDVYIAFNAHDFCINAILPELAGQMRWHRIADTSLPYPENFVERGVPLASVDENARSMESYDVQAHSVVLLETRG